MWTELYWVDGPWPGKLALASRPRGGDWLEEEMAGWRRAGVDTVLSLLTPEEEQELELKREAREGTRDEVRLIADPRSPSAKFRVGSVSHVGSARR